MSSDVATASMLMVALAFRCMLLQYVKYVDNAR